MGLTVLLAALLAAVIVAIALIESRQRERARAAFHWTDAHARAPVRFGEPAAPLELAARADAWHAVVARDRNDLSPAAPSAFACVLCLARVPHTVLCCQHLEERCDDSRADFPDWWQTFGGIGLRRQLQVARAAAILGAPR